MTTIARTYTSLNRNEYAMSREDDFAQHASIRSFVEGKRIPTETDLYRLAIDANEPYRTTTFTDDPEELAALASQGSRISYWIAYADGKVVAKEPAGFGAWRKVSDALNGYVARARVEGRQVEAPSMDKVAGYHITDLPASPPLSTTTMPGPHDPNADRLPRDIRWIDDEDEEPTILPYVEGVTEGAMLESGYVRPARACE